MSPVLTQCTCAEISNIMLMLRMCYPGRGKGACGRAGGSRPPPPPICLCLGVSKCTSEYILYYIIILLI